MGKGYKPHLIVFEEISEKSKENQDNKGSLPKNKLSVGLLFCFESPIQNEINLLCSRKRWIIRHVSFRWKTTKKKCLLISYICECGEVYAGTLHITFTDVQGKTECWKLMSKGKRIIPHSRREPIAWHLYEKFCKIRKSFRLFLVEKIYSFGVLSEEMKLRRIVFRNGRLQHFSPWMSLKALFAYLRARLLYIVTGGSR